MDWIVSKVLNDVYTNDPLTFLKRVNLIFSYLEQIQLNLKELML